MVPAVGGVAPDHHQFAVVRMRGDHRVRAVHRQAVWRLAIFPGPVPVVLPVWNREVEDIRAQSWLNARRFWAGYGTWSAAAFHLAVRCFLVCAQMLVWGSG